MVAWVGGSGQQRPVRRDDLQALQIVAGQAVGPGSHPDAAAQGQPGDAHRGADTARDRAALGREALIEVDEPGARADRRGRPAHGDRGEVADVDDQPARPRPAGVAVAAGTGGERDAELAGERQARRHVGRIIHVGDRGRLQHVEPGIEQQLGGRVTGVTGPDQRACQVLGERGPVRRGRAGRGARDARHGDGGDASGDAEEGTAPQRTPCRVGHTSIDALSASKGCLTLS